MIGFSEEAVQEKKAEFDHLVDSERTADAINDFFIKKGRTRRDLCWPKGAKDEEEWVIRSRAQVMKLPKQRRKEREDAQSKSSATAKAGNPEQKLTIHDKLTKNIRRLSISPCVAKKRH